MQETKKQIPSKVQKTLDEICSLTGIPFQLKDDSIPEDELEERLTFLLRDLKKEPEKRPRKSTPSDILRRFLQGDLTLDDCQAQLENCHFRTGACLGLLLLHFNKPYTDNSDIMAILREITEPSSTFYLDMNDHDLVLLFNSEEVLSTESLRKTAAQLLDTITAEAMLTIRIAYDRAVENLSDLPATYQNLLLSMKIGSIFLSSDNIYYYRNLGLGKLLSRLPREACLDYLEESLPGVDFSEIDEETGHTIRTFFASGLNIAETARILYLHRNTLVYRLDKFKRSTGLDLRNFDDAITCRIGMMIAAYLKKS